MKYDFCFNICFIILFATFIFIPVAFADTTGNSGTTALTSFGYSAHKKVGAYFTASTNGEIRSVSACLGGKNGTPTDNIVLDIYSNSADNPTTSLGYTASIPASTMTEGGQNKRKKVCFF